jgi:hypothetical protein
LHSLLWVRNIFNCSLNILSYLEISKIKTFDNIKKEHKTDEIKFESIKEYSEKIAKELLDQVEKANLNEKKTQSRMQKKFNR